jgi:Polyketide cyclase / dehydrase and lipid transport
MKFTNTVTIARAPVDVFAFLAQFENIPQWNYAISRTWKVSDGPVGVGSTYRQERTVPSRTEETFEVTEYDPDRGLAIEGTLGPFAARLSYRLEQAGGATLITNDVDLNPTGLARLAAPLAASRIKSSVAANLNALKQLLE